MKKIISFVFTMLATVVLYAQNKTTADTILKPIQVFSDKVVWTDAQLPMPPGAKVAILEGDPKKEGVFTMRIKFPPKYLLPAHTHLKDERVTVLSGSVNVGIGDTPDETKATHYKAGCFYVNPARIHHYVFTGNEEAIVQITGLGPWGLKYIEEKK